MLVNLAEFGHEPKSFDLDWPAENLKNLDDGEAGNELTIIDSVQTTIEIAPAGKEFKLVGRVQARLKYNCSRCLVPSEDSVKVEFSLTVRPSFPSGSGEHELTPEEMDIIPLDGNVLDLRELVIDQIIQSRPMVDLCEEQCKGLCSECGMNLNESGCDCSTKMIDPRLMALADFKVDTGNKEN